jgi:hypothetical protein
MATLSPPLPPPTTTTTPPTSPRHHRATIRLTSGEERIFRLLVAAAEAHEAGLLGLEGDGTADEADDNNGGGSGASFYRRKLTSPPGPPPPTAMTVGIRVAGGWVPDKLLDKHIANVNVALGSCSALRRKVSRKQVGKELEGMLSGKHTPPGRALDTIARLHLAGSVFTFPGTSWQLGSRVPLRHGCLLPRWRGQGHRRPRGQ